MRNSHPTPLIRKNEGGLVTAKPDGGSRMGGIPNS